MLTDQEVMARTVLLLRLDVTGGGPADDPAILGGLRSTTVRVVADADSLRSYAGQTALVTLHNQLVMTGLRVDLDIPDLPLVGPQPPLRGSSLQAALDDFAADLIPGGSAPGPGRPELTIALGATPVRSDVRMSGSGPAFRVAPDDAHVVPSWTGKHVPGSIAAAAAAAAEAVRWALPNVEERLGRRLVLPPAWRPGRSRVVARDLTADLGTAAAHPLRDVADVDVVSGGAITQACLYALLRMGVRGDLRVFEPETLDGSNLNRYALSRRSDVPAAKTEVLAALSTDALRIRGVPFRVDPHTLARMDPPLRPAVLVGVDHIPSRWAVQRAAPGSWLSVGSTSHDFVLVSAHPLGQPCAGCTHPRDDAADGDIPTIGFVSLWAGLLQALDLTRRRAEASTAVMAWPLGLDGARGLTRYDQARAPSCPVCNNASRLPRALAR
jgi:hypothetical protein